MTLLFIILTALVVLTILTFGYYVLMLARYPEPMFAQEVHPITTEDGWELKLHRRKPPGEPGEPVFLCHSLTSNHLNFELPEGASLVDSLVGANYDCWLLDLRGCRSAKPAFGHRRSEVTMDDYLERDIPAAIEYIRQMSGHPKVHWIGHSMGGMLLYACDIAFGAEGVASGVTFGSPIGYQGVDYKGTPGLLYLARFAPSLLAALMRTMAPWSQALRLQISAVPTNWDNVHPNMDARAWFNWMDAPPPLVAQEMQHWITNRCWRMQNDELDVAGRLNEIRTPLFALYGALDPFVPHDEAEAFVEGLSSPDKQMAVLSIDDGFSADYNHVDLLMGKDAPEEVYPLVVQWLHDHPIVAKAPAKKKAAAKKKTAAKKAPAKKKAAAKKKAPARKKAAAKKRSARKGGAGA